MPHLALARLLLERNTERLKARARRLDVVDGDRDVSESSAGVAISTGVALEVGVAFRTVVVRQFEDSFATTLSLYFFVTRNHSPSRAKREDSFSSAVKSRPS